VLVERQRHVEVVDALALRDLRHLAKRAQERQAAIADVVAAGAVVHEADDLIPELAMLQDAVGHQPPRSPAPAISTRLRPMPARHRRSSSSRTVSADP
jgi:hypothetical protein